MLLDGANIGSLIGCLDQKEPHYFLWENIKIQMLMESSKVWLHFAITFVKLRVC